MLFQKEICASLQFLQGTREVKIFFSLRGGGLKLAKIFGLQGKVEGTDTLYSAISLL